MTLRTLLITYDFNGFITIKDSNLNTIFSGRAYRALDLCMSILYEKIDNIEIEDNNLIVYIK